ncbi:MAG: PLDc N-terminal domain-containing protein [Dehalococcoidia bacterium]|nr:PLDc N-terminal domain-containing protein [Dehalococcoidia bacterium]
MEVIQVVGVLPYELPDSTLPLLAVIGFGVAGFIFWVTVLVDCLKNETRKGSTRRAWATAIVFTLVVGALLYCLVRRPKRLVELGQ